LYSLREEMSKDPFGVLKQVAEVDFDGVEFAGFHGKSAQEWREALEGLGLQVAGAHIGVNALSGEELNRTLEFNRTLGNRNITVPGLPEHMRRTKEDWLNFAKTLNDLSGELGKRGMRIGYHTHWVEYQPVGGEWPFHLLFGNTKREVALQVDIGHAIRAGLTTGQVIDLVRKYQGRVLSVHVKDYSKSKGYNVVVGEGEVEWPQLLSDLAKYGGTEWLILEQEEYPYKPPMESIRRGLKNLRDLASTLG